MLGVMDTQINTLPLKKGIGFLAIGSELLDGRVHESNALYAARSLSDHGVSLAAVIQCDDVESEIHTSLALLSSLSSIIIVSGGLGPTTDDRTREALAQIAGVELYQDDGALADIRAIFERRKRSFNPTNQKQALFPQGATIIKNPIGTAPGFFLETEIGGEGVALVALPGVPKEYTMMFQESVLPFIRMKLGLGSRPPRELVRVFGLPESEIGGRVEALGLDPSLGVSYRAHFPEIQLKIFHAHDQVLVHDSMERAVAALGADHVFSRDVEERYEDVVGKILINSGATLAVAESCSGGILAHQLTNVSGISSVFRGGVVSYSNRVKHLQLGVPEESLKRYGAVSAEVTEAMALGVRSRLDSDLAIAITGEAGPDSSSKTLPVGTFFVALSTSSGTQTFKQFFLSTRENFKRFCAATALDILRRHLLKLPLTRYQSSER
jgi:nicotinamide-nucleotide amidase